MSNNSSNLSRSVPADSFSVIQTAYKKYNATTGEIIEDLTPKPNNEPLKKGVKDV